MHYSNCKSYNADFDGDEMNVHLPQNYIGISEAYNLAATHKQYIVPTSGNPIRGLIQDFIISAVHMTSKDTYLTKEDYQQIVYASLREIKTPDQRIQLMRPAIVKPKELWTGK